MELPEEPRLSLGAIAGVAREGLLAMCTTVGLAVMGEMMTAEMTAKAGGLKHAKLAQRQGDWQGSAPGSVVLGGRRVPVERPRGRTVAGDEIGLGTYRKMIKRWCAAGMLNAERSFRRLKGYRQMPTFVAALARHVEAVTPACDAARVA